MPVFINNTDIGNLLKGNICQKISELFPSLQEQAFTFRSQPIKEFQSKDVLYVNQREFACTIPDDDVVSVIGSEDATTCHIIVLRHKGSGATCLAHCDGSGTEQGIQDMLATVMKLSDGKLTQRLELHLFGGFCDDRQQSKELTKEILGEFHNQPLPISLVTACITEFNDVLKNGMHWPVLYGIGVHVKSGEIFPATFIDKGPDMALRSTKTFVGDRDMMSIYDYESRELRIKPFNYRSWPSAALWLQQSDSILRQNLSTSPDVEPPDFAAHVRTTLEYVIQNPAPTSETFPSGQPRRYRKDAHGSWIRIK